MKQWGICYILCRCMSRNQPVHSIQFWLSSVTSYADVWVEICQRTCSSCLAFVTSYSRCMSRNSAEKDKSFSKNSYILCRVWVEISNGGLKKVHQCHVTSYANVWVEICQLLERLTNQWLHLTRCMSRNLFIWVEINILFSNCTQNNIYAKQPECFHFFQMTCIQAAFLSNVAI